MRIFWLLLVLQSFIAAGERPNILWITSEDNSKHWLGCYGNEEAQTPRLDQLSNEGIRFLHAYSNAPVCAVARSTLLNGIYAPSQGTQHMRSRNPIPSDFRPYVEYLRKEGYYCTNRSKTDFNIKGNDKAIWDECSGKAHYKNRNDGQPFFSIFNLTVSHESSLFPGKKPSPMMDPSKVKVPPYLPDLPEVRNDIACYHNRIKQLDEQVGKLLDELEKSGLAENTIVFYYSDHGGVIPRGKRYLKETGVNVPLIIRVPEKWKKLSPFSPKSTVGETVAFVDFAPTLLSLVGLETPKQMQGRAFLGEHRKSPDDGEFLYADRFDELYGMRRGWTDGRWKYIRRFTPQLPAAPYSFYQFSQPAWPAWKKAWQDGKLSPEHARIWEAPQAVEELFDLEADPWEINNLASSPDHQERLLAMRGKLMSVMAEIRDTSIVPEPMFEQLGEKKGIVPYVRSESFAYAETLKLAFASGEGKEIEMFAKATKSDDPVERYWGLNGMRIAKKADGIKGLLDDPYSANRVLAAEALWASGDKDTAKAALFKELTMKIDEYSMLNLINTINRLELTQEIPKEVVDQLTKGNLDSRYSGGYVKRFLDRVKK